MEVRVLLEAIEEMGNHNILDWNMKKCLDKEERCFGADCSYVYIGGKNLF